MIADARTLSVTGDPLALTITGNYAPPNVSLQLKLARGLARKSDISGPEMSHVGAQLPRVIRL